jgi:hypothetical protein
MQLAHARVVRPGGEVAVYFIKIDSSVAGK